MNRRQKRIEIEKTARENRMNKVKTTKAGYYNLARPRVKWNCFCFHREPETRTIAQRTKTVDLSTPPIRYQLVKGRASTFLLFFLGEGFLHAIPD